MTSFIKKIFGLSEPKLFEFYDDSKLIINIPLNAKKYLKTLSKQKWNSDKNIDYRFIETVSVGDSLSFWTDDRYAPELKFFKEGGFQGEGLISVVNSKELFEIMWIIRASKWSFWLLSGANVIEKNKRFLKVEFKFKIDEYRIRQKKEFEELKKFLDKKYKPKSKWTLTFQVSNKLNKRLLEKMSILAEYNDEILMDFINLDSINTANYRLIINQEDVFVRYFTSDNHRYKQKQLIRAIKSNVNLCITSKIIKRHPTFQRDCKVDEFVYELTFTPQ